MSLDFISKRRALRLKAELSEGDARPKPGLLSIIYPATNHGEVMPHVVKTPHSLPSSNDKDAEDQDITDKGEKEVDEPGPTKSPSFSQRVSPGESAAVPDSHKRTAFKLGYFGEGRSERFIERCVELITGVSKIESEDSEDDVVKAPADDGDGTAATSKLTNIAKKFSKLKKSYG